VLGNPTSYISSRLSTELLTVDWCGPHALVRTSDEAAADQPSSTWPRRSGHLLIFVTPDAQAHPELDDTIGALLRNRHDQAETHDEVHTVWLAVEGLGHAEEPCAPLVRRVLTEFGLDVVAPEGKLAGSPGTGLFAGPVTASLGWRRFHAGAPNTIIGARAPFPVWERVLPIAPITAAGLVGEQVTAGLLVRASGGAPLTAAHPAFTVPIDPARPKLIIGDGDILPSQVSALLSTLAAGVRVAFVVTPLQPVAAGAGWVSDLSDRLGHAITFSTEAYAMGQTHERPSAAGSSSETLFRPFPAVLRQQPGTLEQEVLATTAPPTGWTRYSNQGYRLGDDGPVTDVVPSGLVLREASAAARKPPAPFDPHGWTLYAGTPGAPLTDALLTALENLLGGISPDVAGFVRIRVEGNLDAGGQERVSRIEQRISGLQPPTGQVAPASQSHRPSTVTTRADEPEKAPAVVSAAPMPIATVSGGNPPVAPSAAPAGLTPPPPAPEPEIEEELAAVECSPWPERASTPRERAEFGALAGGAFTDGLSLVNSALAAWPAMRLDEAEVKADYVAVCVYLSKGALGGAAVNTALRTGNDLPPAAYLACLVAGLRRLPIHRRVTLRQTKSRKSWKIGMVLTDPGFLSASSGCDITIPDANTDVLIWPATARRTSELVPYGPISEVVFLPGRRFKVLDVRTGEDAGGLDSNVPSRTVLVRELTAAEENVDAADAAALAKLDNAWKARLKCDPELIDDLDAEHRLTTPFMRI
jgi:hypothetical protein